MATTFKFLINRKLTYPAIALLVLVLTILVSSCDTKEFNTAKERSIMPDSIENRLAAYKRLEGTKEDRAEYLNQTLEVIRQMEPGPAKREALAELSESVRRLRNLEWYRAITNEMGEMSIRLDDSLGLAETYYNLGNYFRQSGHVDSAYQHYFRAERLYDQLEVPLKAGMSRLSMAIIQKNAKDYVGGEASSVAAIRYLEQTDSLRYLSSAQSNLGLIAYELKQYDRALDYHQQALDIRKGLNNQGLVVSSLNNIGIVYQGKAQYDEAIDYFEQGLAYDSLVYERPATYGRLLDNLAYTKFKAEQRDNMQQQLERALKVRDSIGDKLGAVTSNLHLAEYYESIDSTKRAYEYAEIAFEKSKPLNYHRGILESLELLTKTSSEEEALGFAKKRIEISDSLQDAERAFRNQFARIRFETDELQIEKERVTRQKKQLTILSLSLAVLFLLVYIFFQRQSNKKELRFREAQQTANEEIYQLMLSQQIKFEEGKQLEKIRISEELHDGILGKLFGIRLNLDSLNQKQHEEATKARTRYIEELKQIETEVRQISHDLNSSKFDRPEVYSEVIEKLISDIAELHHLEYTYSVDPAINWETVSNHTKIHLYRILQEALQNVVKHAKAKQFDVSFVLGDDRIQLRVKDDGVGMNMLKKAKGIGLRNMRSRAEKMNGLLTIKSEKGAGTLVNLDAYL